MKKRKGLSININLTNRWLYTLIAIGILSAIGFGVYALTPGVAPNPGHLASRMAPPTPCNASQFLQFDGTNWVCSSLGNIEFPLTKKLIVPIYQNFYYSIASTGTPTWGRGYVQSPASGYSWIGTQGLMLPPGARITGVTAYLNYQTNFRIMVKPQDSQSSFAYKNGDSANGAENLGTSGSSSFGLYSGALNVTIGENEMTEFSFYLSTGQPSEIRFIMLTYEVPEIKSLR
jgi:hypothetical protein